MEDMLAQAAKAQKQALKQAELDRKREEREKLQAELEAKKAELAAQKAAAAAKAASAAQAEENEKPGRCCGHWRPPFVCCLRCKEASTAVKEESAGSKVFIAVFATLCFLFAGAQAAVYLGKFLNILDFDKGMDELPFEGQYKYTYDTGCWFSKFTDADLAEQRKAKVCGSDDGSYDADCIKRGSNWKFVVMFNMITCGVLALSFLLIAIGACSGCVRSMGGLLFCLAGPAFLYSIYQTYMHRMWKEHYSSLCELSLNPSYHYGGVLENFERAPKTYAEDSQLMLALLMYQIGFVPLCLLVGLCPLCKRQPKEVSD